MDAMTAAVTLTLAEAAMVLDPPMSEQQLRAIVSALRWQPSGHRHTGRAGRPAPEYDAARIMQLHAALVPFCDWIDVTYPQATALPGVTSEAQRRP